MSAIWPWLIFGTLVAGLLALVLKYAKRAERQKIFRALAEDGEEIRRDVEAIKSKDRDRAATDALRDQLLRERDSEV